MISKKALADPDQIKVTFTLPVDGGNGQVSVVGDFNGWDPLATPLRRGKKQHVAALTLPAGTRYQFRYLDEHGNWFNDGDADDFSGNAYGGLDGVIDLTRYDA